MAQQAINHRLPSPSKGINSRSVPPQQQIISSNNKNILTTNSTSYSLSPSKQQPPPLLRVTQASFRGSIPSQNNHFPTTTSNGPRTSEKHLHFV
uniref:Uncharacterized protein n=2 Tax=Meloidogyne TaxID=189290 RepID=A0A914M6M6_MELIC|nr:unnamed protein product [Meloidogyne enterolobii]